MSKSNSTTEWRAARRQLAHDTILDAAWALVADEGLAGLSLRDLAKRAGVTTPTVYAYFDSKHAIYDAMFGQAAADFALLMTRPTAADDPVGVLTEFAMRFVDYCTSDVARYQLLFQRTIPGFEPSPDSFEPAVRSLATVRNRMAELGITDERHLDLWTACTVGLVDQQLSNDPGGDRWSRLVDDVVTMYLGYCDPIPPKRTARGGRRPPTPKGTRP